MTGRRCYQCEIENPPDQSFCGNCGAALVLKDFISVQVSKELANSIRDRDVVETESAIKVFEKAYGWAIGVAGILAVPILLVITLLGWLGWKEFNLSKSAQSAKEQIESTVNTARSDISQASAKSIGEVQKESGKTIEANRDSATTAIRLSNDMKLAASTTRNELKSEATSVRTEVANATSELEAAKKLRPEFDRLRSQLAQTSSELNAQQKKISSSEEFVKHVFGTHVSYTFTFSPVKPQNEIGSAEPVGNSDSINNAIVVKTKEATSTVVYMLVPYLPIDGTLQLQRKNLLAPPNSYLVFHNLIILFYGDPPDTLKDSPLFVSFFPDKTYKDTISTIVLRNERIYADGEPMPKYGQVDPDFKGNKWMPAPQKPAVHEPIPKKVTPDNSKEQSLPSKG